MSAREKTTKAPPWKREMTQNAIGPSKLTIARPISAPYSSCSRRIDSGEPSKPARLASTTSGRRPDAALIARATFLEASGNSVPDVHCSGPSAGIEPKRDSGRHSMPSSATGQPPRCASQVTAISASRMPAQRSSGSMVGVGDGAHHRADVERLLAAGVRLLGEDLADGLEVRARRLVRRAADVAVGRVARLGAAREALARRDVGVLVVVEQHLAGAGEVGRAVLRLPVRAHDALVAADAEVVLGRDAAGVVERLLAGQHHRALRRHHEDALGVHQHRRLGVPVRLGADVDAGHDDVDLAARLREGDDAAQRGRDPVHVLRARVHRDARAGGEREPLDRHVELLGEVERGDHAPALGLGQRAEAAGRVAEQDHALHPLRVALGAVA